MKLGVYIMKSLFELLPNLDKVVVCLLLIAITLVISFIFTFVISIKMRGTKGFFITSILMPVVVASVISTVALFLDNTTSGAVRIATIAVALGLIRFRSVNAKAEELLVLFIGIAIGLICGLGYVALGAIFTALVTLIYILLKSVNLFDKKRFSDKKLLKITIPENLEYSDMFNDIFENYLKENELIEVKTTAMGSLFRLSYEIVLKDNKKEKEFIDELRVKNGNLEISILPYMGEEHSL